MHVIQSTIQMVYWTEITFLLKKRNCFILDCDDSCAGNCTGAGPKGCIECAKGYVKSDEEGCKGTAMLNVLLYYAV